MQQMALRSVTCCSCDKLMCSGNDIGRFGHVEHFVTRFDVDVQNVFPQRNLSPVARNCRWWRKDGADF